MNLLEELRSRVRDAHQRPDALTIRADQLQQLTDELNDLRMNPFKDIPKLTIEDIRDNGCWVFGIPVRVTAPAAHPTSSAAARE